MNSRVLANNNNIMIGDPIEKTDEEQSELEIRLLEVSDDGYELDERNVLDEDSGEGDFSVI